MKLLILTALLAPALAMASGEVKCKTRGIVADYVLTISTDTALTDGVSNVHLVAQDESGQVTAADFTTLATRVFVDPYALSLDLVPVDPATGEPLPNAVTARLDLQLPLGNGTLDLSGRIGRRLQPHYDLTECQGQL
jgi:hypothetical protein